MSDLLYDQSLKPFPIKVESNLLKLLMTEKPIKENNKEKDIINNFDSDFSNSDIYFNNKKEKQSIIRKYINSTKNVLNSNDENKTKSINETIELNRDFSKVDEEDIINIVMSKLNLDKNDGKVKSKFDFANMNNEDDNKINRIFKNKIDNSNILENYEKQNSYNSNIMINEEKNSINQGFNNLCDNNNSSSKINKKEIDHYCNGNEQNFFHNNYNNLFYYNN